MVCEMEVLISKRAQSMICVQCTTTTHDTGLVDLGPRFSSALGDGRASEEDGRMMTGGEIAALMARERNKLTPCVCRCSSRCV